jgi:hypothetical protein
MPITKNASIQTAMSPWLKYQANGEEITDAVKVTNDLIYCVIFNLSHPTGIEIGELPLWRSSNLVPLINCFSLRKPS